MDTNTQVAGDPPPPQNGDCPGHAISPITHTRSCWVFMDNDVHDNNNPDPPAAGSAAAGPIGTGMTVSGGRNDTVMDNTFADNGSWGTLFVPYPDAGTPSPGVSCSGSGGHPDGALGCVYDPEGNALLHNTYRHDGFFRNQSNADFGQITLFPSERQNCFVGNRAPAGSVPADLEEVQATCGLPTKRSNTGGPLLAQVGCDSGFLACSSTEVYPKRTGTLLAKVPGKLPTMLNACAGMPTNPWCPTGSSASALASSHRGIGAVSIVAVGAVAPPGPRGLRGRGWEWHVGNGLGHPGRAARTSSRRSAQVLELIEAAYRARTYAQPMPPTPTVWLAGTSHRHKLGADENPSTGAFRPCTSHAGRDLQSGQMTMGRKPPWE